MKFATTRFGELEIQDDTLITLSAGMVGFPKDTLYAFIPHRDSADVAWLQSVQNPSVAFPLLNATRVGPDYPDVPLETIAEQAGIAFENVADLALLVVLSASAGDAPTVNLMAPVVINVATRVGAQVVLVGSRFQTARLGRKSAERGAHAGL
ncbi:MAG: hypothetical protein B6A08_05905 [Sorangiineae bacterium NIC37A_2]|jgi:flagellar assembly factor FliW|nr:MAG: hypothetical protein B6A08_05905 [Sorangiineae bacterium NIC37A_2]